VHALRTPRLTSTVAAIRPHVIVQQQATAYKRVDTVTPIVGKEQRMDLQGVVAVAKQHIEDAFAAAAPRDVRLGSFLYDDHLMVWMLTIGFASASDGQETRFPKIVRGLGSKPGRPLHQSA
jgi:hypothetical protein